MKFNTSLVRFLVLAIIVVLLGGLAGWYLFVNRQIEATDARDDARGFDTPAGFGSSIGSGISNLVGGVIDGILGNESRETSASAAPELWQITRTPVAGHGFASSTSRLYFAERASGNILTAEPATARVERLTNTLFPRVIEALFSSSGSVVLRFIDDSSGRIASFAGIIATSSSPAAGDTPNKLMGVALPMDIASMSVRSAPDGLFYIRKEEDGSSGYSADWQGSGTERIFISALSDWDAITTDDGAHYIVQKASDDVAGFAFEILKSGALERVLGNLPGLSVLPRSGSEALLYSTSAGGVVSLYARIDTDTTEIRLPVRTIAKKCVWAPDSRLIAYCAVPQTAPSGAYLRGRYDGTVHTADAWWRVDVSSNTAEQIFAPELSLSLDVESPRIDASGTHIAFMNAADKTLWMLTLEQ